MAYDSDRQSAGKYISILHRAAHRYFKHNLKQYNIGIGQIPVLMALFHNNGISQENAAKYFNMDKSTTAVAVQQLVNAGYVTKRVNAEDKRAYKLYFTKKGAEIMPHIAKSVTQWTNILLKDFSPEEKTAALDLLDRMSKNAIKEICNEKHKE